MKEVYGGQRTVLIRVNMTKQMILDLNHLGHFSVFGMNLKKKKMNSASHTREYLFLEWNWSISISEAYISNLMHRFPQTDGRWIRCACQ